MYNTKQYYISASLLQQPQQQLEQLKQRKYKIIFQNFTLIVFDKHINGTARFLRREELLNNYLYRLNTKSKKRKRRSKINFFLTQN